MKKNVNSSVTANIFSYFCDLVNTQPVSPPIARFCVNILECNDKDILNPYIILLLYSKMTLFAKFREFFLVD